MVLMDVLVFFIRMIMVMVVRLEEGCSPFILISFSKDLFGKVSGVVDGVVVYPRLGRIREREKLDISPSMIVNILKVYHIAEKGLIPLDYNSSYCSKCRYRSVCESTGRNKLVDLNNVEIPVPLPLVVTLEIAEDYDVDLDLLFLGDYFQDLERRIQLKYLSETASDRLTGLLERSLKISDEEFAGFLERYTNLSHVDILEALGEIKQSRRLLTKFVGRVKS